MDPMPTDAENTKPIPVAVFVFDDRVEYVYEYVPQHVAFSQPGLRAIWGYQSYCRTMQDMAERKRV